MNIDNDEQSTSATDKNGSDEVSVILDIIDKERSRYKVAVAISEWHRKTLAAQRQSLKDEVLGATDAIGNKPMPRFGKSGKYVKSPQSFQDGFEEARAELRTAISTIFEGEEKSNADQ